jgi:Ser/Thr protein kinase RdoA (MazF antagonist)
MPDLRPALDRFHQLTSSIPQRPGFVGVTELLSMDLGGDVDLAAMPEILARQCRAAWRALGPGDVGVIHGDLNRLNVVRTPDGCPGLLDWDEARVDLRLFDLAQVSRRRPGAKALRAMQAWEMACSWRIEPPYALELARRHFGFGELSAPGDL